MRFTSTVQVTAPKKVALSPQRIALVLKHLIQIGQQLCRHTSADTKCNAAIEADALKLTIGTPKPAEPKPIRIAVFVHDGNVQDVYANVQGIDVTLVDHDNGEVDEATNERNEQIVESMGTAFPFNCY